jgi:predicted MFS family arabinose efflux permease
MWAESFLAAGAFAGGFRSGSAAGTASPVLSIGYHRVRHHAASFDAVARVFMSPRAVKAGVYAVTSLSTIATFYHFSYLFFLLRDRYGFDNRMNLRVAALHGAVYVFAAWQGGRFAERRGSITSLKVGLAGLVACMTAGALVTSAAALLAVMVAYTVVLLLIWPALEALATADVPPDRVPHMVGVYNLTWSGSAALAYFTGGPLYDWLGARLIFTVPAFIFLVEFGFVSWLGRRMSQVPARADVAEVVVAPIAPPPELRAHPEQAFTFLRLAWLANPLSYVAIYTLLAVMPGIAGALGLTPTEVGLFCSIWFFARLVSFGVLWRWPGWHYRFRFLAGGYALLMISFLSILLAPNLIVLVIGQVVFGASAGLTYYSSLFYSMDLSEAKAEHGGLHEAGIGLGICAGPAVGTLSLQLFPAWPHAGALAVTGVLAGGLIAMLTVWWRGVRR